LAIHFFNQNNRGIFLFRLAYLPHKMSGILTKDIGIKLIFRLLFFHDQV